MKNIILTLMIALMAISASAQDFLQEAKRTPENPRVTAKDVLKNMKNDPSILEHALKTPLLKSDIKVYDFSGTMSAGDIERLRNRCLQFIKENGVDVMVVFVNQSGWTEADNRHFMEDLYDYNDFGTDGRYSGIRLVINFATHEFSFQDVGSMDDKKIAYNNHGYLCNAMVPYFREDDYAGGVINYMDVYQEELDSQKIKTTGWDFCLDEPRSMQDLKLLSPRMLNLARANDSVLKAVMETPAVVTDYYVYDFARELDADQIKEIQQRCRKFSQKNQSEIAFFLVKKSKYNYGWTQTTLDNFVDDITKYNSFARTDKWKGGIYLGRNIANSENSAMSFGNCGGVLKEDDRWNHYNRFWKYDDSYKSILNQVDLLDCFINDSPMVEGGISLEQKIDQIASTHDRIFDISGIMDISDRDTINMMLDQISKETNREFYATAIFAPTFKEKDLKYLARQTREKCKGEKICMMVINEYDHSYIFEDEDDTRVLKSQAQIDDADPYGNNSQLWNRRQIGHALYRYHYHTMTVGERVRAYKLNWGNSLCLAIPLLVIMILAGNMLKKRKYGVKEYVGARRYLVNGSYVKTKDKTIQGETTVTKTYVQPSSRSYSGGGGSRSSSYHGSSGRSSSGGSGRW
ncbi:MAG: TPM domain-containing protein [Bacteroidales bacterium]|nr:TPM domain-containing protein [Bacteroidales bacterium]